MVAISSTLKMKNLDFSSQLMCSNLGIVNKMIAKAVYDQLNTLEYIQSGYATEIRAKVSSELKSIPLYNLAKYFFRTSGTDGNETAIKMIILFHKNDGKIKIFSNYTSYKSRYGNASLI